MMKVRSDVTSSRRSPVICEDGERLVLEVPSCGHWKIRPYPERNGHVAAQMTNHLRASLQHRFTCGTGAQSGGQHQSATTVTTAGDYGRSPWGFLCDVA